MRRTRTNDDENSSSGLLLYAALVDLLAEDFLSEEAQKIMTKKDKITAFIFVLLGGEYKYPSLFSIGFVLCG